MLRWRDRAYLGAESVLVSGMSCMCPCKHKHANVNGIECVMLENHL